MTRNHEIKAILGGAEFAGKKKGGMQAYLPADADRLCRSVWICRARPRQGTPNDATTARKEADLKSHNFEFVFQELRTAFGASVLEPFVDFQEVLKVRRNTVRLPETAQK